MKTVTRKTLKIEDLKAKHFIAWLRKQVRTTGRHTSVGYLGGHPGNPVEMWLQELTGEEYIVTSSCEYFEIGEKEYRFSQAFRDFSISVLEGDPEREDWQSWYEVTAWDMLQSIDGFMDKDVYLVERAAQQEEEENTEEYGMTPLRITVKDGKNKDRVLTVLYAFVNESRTLCARIKSDNGKVYFARVRKSLYCECSCSSFRTCYHTTAIIALAQSFLITADGIYDPSKPVVTIGEAMTAANEAMASRIAQETKQGPYVDYDALGTDKKPSRCPGCKQELGDVCFHGFCYWNSKYTENYRDAKKSHV